MTQGQVLIKYQGFHPSSYAEEYVKTLIQEISEESPRGAHVRATITKKDNLFKTVVHVRSSAGPFFTSATDSSLKDSAERVLTQMRRQIEKWQTKKMRGESLKDIHHHYEDNATVA